MDNHKIYCLIILFLFFSCNKFDTNRFTILPTPKKTIIDKKYSNINSKTKLYYFSENNDKLPVILNQELNLHEGEKYNSQLFFEVDNNSTIVKEGYYLEISDDQIRIKAKDRAGLFYAFNTLSQLIQDAEYSKVNLPVIKIEDYPSLTYRSVHLDIKHHTEKKDYYYSLIDELASIKINGIIVEFEDKLGYEKRPLIASTDSYSIEWWKNLSKYAIERNIQISPLIQGLGHASYILKHEKYSKLRDVSNNDWAFNPLDPETYEIQFDLYRDAIEATPHGKYLHVGGDEVRVVDRDDKKGFELNLLWLNKVSNFAMENDRIPIFWDDMYLKHGGVWNVTRNTELSRVDVEKIWEKNKIQLTEYIDDFPKNCIYMRWNYFYPWAEGNLKTIDWYKENNMKVMGATAGQTRWILMPQDFSNIESIKSFSLTSVKKNLNGLLLTLWDDDSPHFELYKRGIYSFAEYTWGGKDLSSDIFKSNFRHRYFSPHFKSKEYNFIDKLDNPVRDWANLFLKEKKHRNQISKNLNSLNTHIIELPNKKDNLGEWSKKFKNKIENVKTHLDNINEILSQIENLKKNTIRGNYTIDVYEQVAILIKFSYETFLAIHDYDNDRNKFNNLIERENIFVSIRENFEKTYSKTRNINKPVSYMLDQDHHNHTANQTLNMDWQFIGEIKLFEKINLTYN